MMRLQPKLTTLFHSMGLVIRCVHHGQTYKVFAGPAIMTKRTEKTSSAKMAVIPICGNPQTAEGAKKWWMSAISNRVIPARKFFT